MDLHTNQSWLTILKDGAATGAHDAVDSLLRTLTAEVIEQLVQTCERGTHADATAALRVLLPSCSMRDVPFESGLKERWTHWLEQTARAEFPNSPLGLLAFQAWRKVRRSAAEAVLVAMPADAAKDERALEHVIIQLESFAAFGSASALSRLRRMEAVVGGGPKQVLARALDQFRVVRDDEIEAWAEDWRAHRSLESLNQLYRRYIQRLRPGDASIAELERLLGPPDERRGQHLWYQPNSATQLFLEGDSQGRLCAMRWTS